MKIKKIFSEVGNRCSMVKTSSAADFEKVPRSRNYRMQQKSPHSNAVPRKVRGKGLTTEKALAIILYIILYVNLYIK